MIKHLLIFLISFAVISFADAQTYLISSYNNQTITTCSGTFYDSGGASSGYIAGQSYVVTFKPTTNFSNITFTSFSVAIGDMLEVFDGADVNATLIGIFNNGNSPVGQTIRATFLGSQGKLTFRWTSVGAGTGWAANVSCGIPCQSFSTAITSSTPPFTLDSGIYYIDICPGDTVSLHASATFPLNNYYYHQDTSTTSFSWNFGGATTVSGQNVTANFNNVQGYNVYILAEDTIGCSANQTTEVRIRVSTPPIFSGTNLAPDPICQFDSTLLMGFVTPTHWEIIPSLSVAGTTYLPDGSGVSYTSTLVFTGFATGQTLQQASDILQIFAEIEHSYLGDLNIALTCPNNSSITLKSYPGGTSTFLGEPIDGNAQPVPGLGYMYHWKSTGTTTMLAAANTYSYSFTDVLGNSYTNHNYIPPSTVYPPTSTATGALPIVQYLPETPFTNLLGCPLNGAWSITVTDNLAIDNGFIFSWGIDFDPSILPVSWGYTPTVDSTHWNVGIGDTTYYAIPNAGPQTATYTMIDNAGCIYDTTLNITVLPSPIINLGNDTNICKTDSITLNSGSTLATANLLWSNGGNTNSINVAPDSTSLFTLIATSPQGCSNYDTVEVAVHPLPVIIMSDDTLICIGTQADLQASGGNIYQWSNGGTTPTTTVSPIITTTYFVTVTDSHNCVSDSSIEVFVAKLPIITISNDTVICDGSSANIWAKGGVLYNWDNGINTSAQSVQPTSTQDYTVVVEDTNTCIDSSVVNVDILDIPEAKIISDFDTLCRGGTVSLTAKGGMKYIWQNGSKSSSQTYTPQKPIRFYVKAINEKSGTECFDTTSYYIYVENCAVYVPTAFTPNGDGLNDFFGAKGIVSNNANFQMMIYNRYGRVVFQTTDLYDHWDGFNNGQPAMEGVYTWLIIVHEATIKPYEIVGTVSLLR